MDEKEALRRRYFNFFRWRLNRAGSSKSLRGMVVVCRYLGFLAEHWMATSEEQKLTTPTDRMRVFLTRHGHHDAWSRVSALVLRNRADSERERAFIEARFPFERFAPDRVNPVATWKNDPPFGELEASGLVSRESLVASSYAGLVYDELISKSDEDPWPGARSFETPWHDELAEGAPRYRYDSLTMDLRLLIPVSFLVETAERAVRSFEAEATERDIVPFPTQA